MKKIHKARPIRVTMDITTDAPLSLFADRDFMELGIGEGLADRFGSEMPIIHVINAKAKVISTDGRGKTKKRKAR